MISQGIHIKIEETEKGKFTVSKKAFAKNDLIFYLEGGVQDFPTQYTIQIGPVWHLLPKVGMFLNHSCEPNGYIDVKNAAFRALRDINEGEELTFNYNTTEYDISKPFECWCGKENCYKEVKGFKYLTIEQKDQIYDRIPDYFKIKKLTF